MTEEEEKQEKDWSTEKRSLIFLQAFCCKQIDLLTASEDKMKVGTLIDVRVIVQIKIVFVCGIFGWTALDAFLVRVTSDALTAQIKTKELLKRSMQTISCLTRLLRIYEDK